MSHIHFAIRILNGASLFGIMQKILLREEEIDQNREHFWVVGLENNNRILFIELISLGSVNQTIAEPMEVFSLALQKRAVKIILVHNHPSGELIPSEPDKDITNRLIQVGKIVRTKVLDHLIITTESYVSFADIGLMKKLARSKKYVPDYIIEEKLKNQAEALIMKKGEKKARLKIAKKMKKDGLSNELISDYTSISIDEIKKIKVRKNKK